MTGASNAGGVCKNCYFRPIAGFGIDDAGPSSVVNISSSTISGGICLSRETACDEATRINLVYDRKPRRYAEDNRTEFNCRPTY